MASGQETQWTRRHEKYYFSDGDLFLLIENHYFCIHRSVFERESTVLQGHLAVHEVPGRQGEGDSEACALVLNNIRRIDFERLLSVFYNPQHIRCGTTLEEWTSILDLAHRWSVAQVMTIAIRELEKITMPDIDRIVLYHKYGVDKSILVPRYSALVAREYSLDIEEGKKLGIETTVLIAHARDCARSYMSLGGGPTPMPDVGDFLTNEEFLRDIPTDIFVRGNTI